MYEASESGMMELNLNQSGDTSLPSSRKKRGRPCKGDTILLPKEIAALGVHGKPVKAKNTSSGSSRSGVGNNSLVGQTVHGVLDGSFDAGYLISVRIGESDTIFRGVVFGPGLSIPPSKTNDVASNVKQTKRDMRKTPTPVTLSETYKAVPIIEPTPPPTVMTEMEVELKNRLELPQQTECVGITNTVPEVPNGVDEDYKLEICDPVEAIKACLRNQNESIQNDAHTCAQPE